MNSGCKAKITVFFFFAGNIIGIQIVNEFLIVVIDHNNSYNVQNNIFLQENSTVKHQLCDSREEKSLKVMFHLLTNGSGVDVMF